MHTLANCASEASDAMAVACDLCGRKLANSGAMKSHRRSCLKKLTAIPADSRKRRCNGGGELLEWELAEQLNPRQVDGKLWAGAAAEGWRVVPKYRGAAAKSHWCAPRPAPPRPAPPRVSARRWGRWELHEVTGR